MQRRPLTYIVILFALFFTAVDVLQGQHHTHAVADPVFSAIDEARDSGQLSEDESLIQKFYAGYRPELLNDEFRTSPGRVPIKCMVPAMQEFYNVKDRLSPATISEVNSLTESVSASTEFSYLSPSGNFILYYDTTGTHRVPTGQTIPEAIEQNIPDYVYHAAFAADSSYRYQVEKLGFTDFVKETPYEIDFQNFGFYGTTTSSGSSTYITIHSNFRNFPPNTHPESNPIGALYATVAHEIKHAIQYAANRWRGSAGGFNWTEMDATLMEEIVFDDVNDYYNYIMAYDPARGKWDRNQPDSRSIFGNPQSATPGAYWHITWMLYFAETFGMEFWRDMWENVREQPLIPFFDAVEDQLLLRNTNLETQHLKNHLWHLASGNSFSQSGFGFRERELYPASFIQNDFFSTPDSVTEMGLRSMAAHYISASPNTSAIGQPNVRIRSTAPGVGIGMIATFRDGSEQMLYSVNPSSTDQQIQSPWHWNDLSGLKIAVVNTNRQTGSDYTLILDSVLPEEDILAQNYPNPFNPSTRIEFSLNDQKDVRIEVFDSVGRRISTLLNSTLGKGFHFVDFDGSDLATGVYFYRIITDQTVATYKMMLLK